MNDQKKIMNIFAQAYQLIAKASKQQPSQEGFQQVLEMLGEDGIKQCAEVVDQGPEAVAQAMVQILQQKSTQKAANGAKLRYLMQLKGKCDPGYLKKGGRCKPCEMSKGSFRNKADLLQGGGNTPAQQGRVAYKAYPNDNLDSNELKWINQGYYPIRTYNGQIASFMTDADAKSEYNLPPYNPEKYSRIIPWDDEDEVMSQAFDRADQFNKNPKFKDRLNVFRQYLKDPKKFTEGIYIR